MDWNISVSVSFTRIASKAKKINVKSTVVCNLMETSIIIYPLDSFPMMVICRKKRYGTNKLDCTEHVVRAGELYGF
jgi:hypothetical protein